MPANIRDVSPPTWNAPGKSKLFISAIASLSGQNPIPIDTWISNFAPIFNETINLVNGFNQINILDQTNSRIFIFVPPRGNAVTITLKGVTGDTGIPLNPNGPLIISLPGNVANVNLTTGGAIAGCRVIIF